MTPVANVDAIVLGLNAEGEALNQVYNISNGEPVALWPMLNGVLKKLSLAPISKSVPLPVVLAVARAMEWHARLFNGHREPALTVAVWERWRWISAWTSPKHVNGWAMCLDNPWKKRWTSLSHGTVNRNT